MAILNYTTFIQVEKTAAEIQRLLAAVKAQAVLTEYEDGVLTAISFRVQTAAGLMSFRMPANVQKVYQVIVRDRSVPPRLRSRDQAARVAWRIMKDWLEAQLALIRAGMVDLEQVFLPYAQDASGVTLYDALKEQRFNGLALTNG